MSTPFAHRLPAEAASSVRVRVLSLLGPGVVAAGVLWGILQPWRVTLLHPHGQGFWWLVAEPPLLVAAAGIVFSLVVAKPLLADLEEHRASAG